jgi:hypothetical protein
MYTFTIKNPGVQDQLSKINAVFYPQRVSPPLKKNAVICAQRALLPIKPGATGCCRIKWLVAALFFNLNLLHGSGVAAHCKL